MFFSDATDSVFLMPKEVLKYIQSAKKSEMRFIMYFFSKGNFFNEAEAASELCETPESISASLAFWRGTGIIKYEDGESKASPVPSVKVACPERKSPSFDTSDVSEAMIKNNEFRHIVQFCEQTLGDLPNQSKQAQLYYLYSVLGMQSDVIIGIIAHCASVGKTRFDYIKKTAEGIHNDGVVTYKELETYLKAKEDYKNFESSVRRVIGCGERAFTKSERDIISTWEKDWSVSEELLELAYERTISLISKPSLPYMSKILENWHTGGIDNAEKAREALAKQGHKFKDAEREADEKAKRAGFDLEFEDIYEKP